MEFYVKHNFYNNFVDERVKALQAVNNTTYCREISPWDRVGAESTMDHTPEVHQFIKESIGENYEIVNKKRHFNLCMKNPYNFAHIHYDDYDYILLIYLNFETQYTDTDGTRIVSHKVNGDYKMTDKVVADIDHYYADFEIRDNYEDVLKQEEVIQNSEYMQPDKWNVDLFIPMKKNKAMMFECRYLHSETNNFGECMTSARLVEVVYINRTK